MSKLMDIEGIGEVFAQKLNAAGIKSVQALLQQGSTAQGRKAIAERTSISKQKVLEWVNHLDLFRVKGIAGQYADLLEEAGVDTVKELAQRNAQNLHEKMVLINQEKKLVRQLPGESQLRDWIQQASRLPRMISY
jgi:predicted flap endonuclease-1-like 5' DNA nuclease